MGQLERHNQCNNHSHHNNEYFCDYNECTKVFTSKWKLNKHKMSHYRLYKCIQCQKRFSSAKHLRIHQRSHDNERNEKCRFCNKYFLDSSTLRNHIKCVHSESIAYNPDLCRICYKSFVKRSLLRIHHSTHLKRSQRRLLQCEICKNEKTFTTQSNLNRHYKNMHANNRHS